MNYTVIVNANDYALYSVMYDGDDDDDDCVDFEKSESVDDVESYYCGVQGKEDVSHFLNGFLCDWYVHS